MKTPAITLGIHNFPRRLTTPTRICLPALLLLLLTTPAWAANTHLLPAQVSAAVARLKPIAQLAATNELKLAIGLPLRNQAALDQFLRELNDPAHPNYRHYLTPEEFAAQFGPTEQDHQAVIAFAQANGLAVGKLHPNRTLVDVSGSAADIGRALHVTLSLYRHPTEGRTFYAPDTEPTLDPAVPVLGIRGLDNYALPRPRLQATPLDVSSVERESVSSVNAPTLPRADAPTLPRSDTPNAGSGPSGTYMGNDFRAAYLPDTALNGSGQSVGLLQFDGYTAGDITYYESQAGLPNVPLVNVLLDGATGQPSGSGGEVEVSLDIQMAISMAPGLSQVIVYMARNPSPFVDLLNRMATDNLAKQLSCSWYMPGGGIDAVADQIFQQMASQGQSFYNASGDYDAFTGPVDFPGETPYIVQVGGTTLTTSGPGGAYVSETVWNRNNGIGSGGGISTRYTIPSYQTDVDMTHNQGSTTMRNIPDVALTAENVYVRANGRDYKVGGTSCSAPLWAGFTALVNQQAVGSGRPVVGFINPAVDAIGHAATYTTAFHDITTGDNTSSSSPSKFYAQAGYDLCTGWGTPAGQKLINALATPDALLITPGLGLAFSGGVGGPFSPNPGWLTLTNTGTNAFSWTLVNTSAWFNVSPTSGTLLPGGAASSVSVSASTSASGLTAGVYSAVVVFTNLGSGVGQTVPLALSVAVPSMADDFDPGLDLTQWSSFGGVVGGTVLATNYGGSVSGPNSLWFGASGSRYATTVPVNTAGGGQIGFCLRLANGSAWPWARVDSLPAEGVVLECSTNGGGNWTAIGNYDTAAYYNWTGVAMSIPTVAKGPAVLFRWRQLANDGANYDHWALDNVFIGTGSLAPRIIMDPQNQSAARGDPASLSVAAIGTLPLRYQWLLNGASIAGATASSLVWTNVQLADAGTYSVFISNSVGTAMSANAVLTVYIPVCSPPSPGLVSWWAAEGDAQDVQGANNGSLQGGVTFARGKVGQAFNFDGTSQYVNVADSPSLNPTASISLEAWIYPRLPVTSIAPPIIKKAGEGLGQQDGYALELHSAGEAVFGVFVSGGLQWALVSSPPLPTNQWSHIVGVFDGTHASIYVNGALAASPITASGRIVPSGNDLQIGHDPCNPPRYFNGLIDEASVYATALSPTEILALYAAGNAGKCQTSPPSILTQPLSQTAGVGSSASLSVVAAGSRPLTYQWSFNGANLAGATDSTLTLSNLKMSDSGSYAVAITNAYGWAVSSNAALTVSVLTCAPVPAGIISWWAAEGNALDWLGLNTGVLRNGAGFASGKVGQAFNLDGSSQYVDVPSSASLNPITSVSLEAWIYPRPPYNSVSSPVIKKAGEGSGQGDGYVLELNNTGAAAFGVFLSTSAKWVLTAAVPVPSNQWSHVVGVYDGAKVAFYLNGALAGTPVAASGQIAASGNNLQIGHDPSNPPRYFNGLIDEACIYGTALSAAQIQATYNAGSAGKCPPTIAPSILTQPQSQTIPAGTGATVGVAAIGASPLAYQWRFNGANLSAATSASLTLSNAQPANSGPYDVVITNLYGSVTSAEANLLVLTPPQITSQPQDQTVVAGTNVTFAVTAIGSSPLRYQWYFNGTPLSQATNSTLVLEGVSFTQGGLYNVWASNAVGAVSSRRASLIVLGAGACVAPPPGLVSWWTAEGDAFDSAGTNIGTLQNGVAFASGEVGQAFNLNGTSQYVDVPSSASLNPTASLTVETWIYPRLPLNSVGSPVIKKAGEGTSQQDGYTLEFIGTNGVMFSVYVNGGRQWVATPLVPLPFSRWSHVAGVYDGTNLSIYVNGALVGAPVSGPGQIVSSGNNLQIGHDPSNPSRYFNGLIDEASLYRVALSAAQIQAIYAANTAGKCQPATPPSILKQPQSQTVPVGASPGFSVLAGGVRPVGYQWRFNGASILSATTSSVTLTNAQLTNSGSYDVVVVNPYGSATSSVASLTVMVPPQITSQPQDQIVVAGTRASFNVGVIGTSPLVYQWYFDGISLKSATNSTLLLNGVLMSQAGTYSVIVSNAVGKASSSNASLVVLDNNSCDPPPTGLVSWWTAETTAADSAGTNNGTLRNGLGFAPGRVGQAFNLNGTSQYVDVPSNASLSPTGSLSVEAWVYPRLPLNSVSSPVIKKAGEGTGQQDGYSLELFPSGAAVFSVYLGGTATWAMTPAVPVPSNQWSHVAGVFDGTNVALYVNGVPSGVAGASGQMAPSGNNLQIGHDPSNASRYFNGLIDEASVYQSALSASQVQAIYNAGSAGKCHASLPPSILAPPQSQTVLCSSNVTFVVGATGSPVLTYRWYFGANFIPSATNALLTLTNVGSAQAGSYSVVVANGYGSATGGPAVLMVLDTTPPTIISCASNRTLSVVDNCKASLPDLTSEVVATDASGPVTVTQNPPPGTLLGLGATNVAFTVRDSSSNAASCSCSIAVADTTPPFVLACVLDLSLDLGANCQALLPDLTTTNYIVARDNCSSVTVAQTPPAGTALPAGTNTVVLTVSDAASNQTTRAVAVIALDRTPPVLRCPGGKVLEFQDERGAVATYSVTATDSCSAVSLVVKPASGSLFPIGVTPVLARATDSANNSAQDSFTVTVLGALGVKSNVLAELVALRSNVKPSKQFSQKLDEAIEHLADSLNPAYWIDQTHLQPRGGNTAMNDEKLAVNKLREIMDSKKSPFDPAVLQGFIDRIVKCDRLLAVISIQDAAAAGLDPKKVAAALALVAKGDAEAVGGHYANAIEHYRDAWRHALRLRLQVGLNPDGSTQLHFVGNSGAPYRIEVSTDMVHWVTLGACTADAEGNVEFSDSAAVNLRARFYRAVEQ